MPKREEASVEKSKEAPSERWADQAEDGEEVNWDEEGGERVVSQEKLPDGSVLKTIVEYTTNDRGQSVKITKRVKQHKVPIKINRRVESRKKWRKFGECAGRVGIETGVTMMSADDVYLELTDQAKKEIEPSLLENSQKKKELLGFMVCRICGKVGDHWTLNCPLKGKIGAPTGGSTSERAPVASSKDRYVPPSIRTRGSTGSTVESSGPRERVEATLRVSNLSEEARDSDVSELFRPFGPVSRIYLAKDKNGKSKGFAFVTFIHRDHAERALNKLNGFGYDHLILHVEWAKPSRD